MTDQDFVQRRLNRISGVFDRSHIGLTLADMNVADCPLVLVNRKFEVMTGYRSSEMIGKNCRFLQRDGENIAERAEIRDALANRTETQVILRNYRKDGQVFDNLLFLHPIEGTSGDLRYMLGSQFVLERTERVVQDANAHASALSDDIAKISETTERLRTAHRRQLADASAFLVRAWARG